MCTRVRASRGLKFYRVWWVWDWDSELLIRILKPKLGRVSNRQKSCSRLRLLVIYKLETQASSVQCVSQSYRNRLFHIVILTIWPWDGLETESQGTWNHMFHGTNLYIGAWDHVSKAQRQRDSERLPLRWPWGFGRKSQWLLRINETMRFMVRIRAWGCETRS